MLRSMFAGVTGLRAHQQMMDVIGNNIANVNTTGFKSSATEFADLLSQMTVGASSPSAVHGGTDPNQVGLGVQVAGVVTSFTQGASRYTGRATDLAIQGDGFFITRQDGQTRYTRAGDLTLDATGNLVTPQGGVVQGWLADTVTHKVNTNTQTTNLTFPSGQVLPPLPTGNVVVGGSLPADATLPQAGPPPIPGTTIDSGVTIYDQQGIAVPITLEFSFQSANTWQVLAKDASGTVIPNSTKTLTFDPTTGQLKPAVSYSFTPPTGSWPGPVKIDFGLANSPNALVQFAGQPRVNVISQDGAPVGSLQSFNVANDGTVTGVFSNGQNISLGQIALATFTNPAGLEKAGDSSYRSTLNSGLAQVGTSGTSGRGTISAGTLEMSNVDLASEFTNLIVAQRGFQANSRVITTADQILQDLVNMK